MHTEFVLNTREIKVEAPSTETLLTTLRERLQLTGSKEACVEGECGACTVLVNGRPVDSCIYAGGRAWRPGWKPHATTAVLRRPLCYPMWILYSGSPADAQCPAGRKSKSRP